MDLSAETCEDSFGHSPACAVCAVYADLESVEAEVCRRNQVIEIAFAARDVIDRATDRVASGKRHLYLAVYVVLDLLEHLRLHLEAFAVDELDAVVLIGVMACGNHDAAVKASVAHDVGDGGCRCHV